MKTAGIICEFNPFHKGHEYLLSEVRRRGYNIICVMSGNFVQRGDIAVLDKFSRAESAVKCGADLVLELPTPWACATAQRFARGGVGLLADSAVDTLFFGSECGDISLIRRAAALTSGLDNAILAYLSTGMDYAAARQRAAEEVDPAAASLLSSPNDILAVEYARESLKKGLDFDCIKREGSEHDGFASASWIRQNIYAELSSFMPPQALAILLREIEKGTAPVYISVLGSAIMAIIKRMTAADFALLPDVSEGLEYRLARAAHDAGTFSQFCEAVKTKRYTMARIRRIAVYALLGLHRGDFDEGIPYARVLAFNDSGRELIKGIKIPVLTKTADVKGDYAKKCVDFENLCDDIYSLACPDEKYRAGGRSARTSPIYIK